MHTLRLSSAVPGTSLLPVMMFPSGPGVKDVTISQFPRCWQNNTHYEGPKPGDENNRTSSWESMSDCHWTDRCENATVVISNVSLSFGCLVVCLSG